MKTLSFLLLGASLVFSASSALAQSAEQQKLQQEQRVAASFVLALGRAPSAGELAEWTAQGKASIADLTARHRQQLQSNAALQRATIVKAFQDAYGRSPTNDELNTWSAQHGTYAELTNRLIAALAENPKEYEQAIERAYQLVARRGVYREEIDYWQKNGPLPYALLVGCVHNWARRNQPGLMVTVGTPTISVNSLYLTTVRLSPALAEEARAAIGLPSLRGHYVEADYVGGTGRTIVAPGAEKIVSNGKIHFVAAGGPALATAE